MSNYKAEIDGEHIVFNLPYALNHLAKSAGARFHQPTKMWRTRINKITASAVVANFPEDQIDPRITQMAGESVEIPAMSFDPDTLIKDRKLRPRQRVAIEKAWPHPGFAFFHVMGAGKTLSTIALANSRRHSGLIERLLIICPTSIKGVWEKEFRLYSNAEQDLQVLESGKKLKPFSGFEILIVGVEALSQGSAIDVAKEFVDSGKCMTVVDESSTIKNHDSIRTENCWMLAEGSNFRLILTGTNVTQGIQDLYAQMYFVGPSIVGELSYYGFRNKYCVMGGFEQRKIIGYANTEHLFNRIRPYCDVVRKGDMKLPPKQYQVREVKATPEQHRACKELAREMITQLGDKTITVQNALEAMLRFQQIAGGFDPDGAPLAKNPKMTELVSVLREADSKAIIWARYLPEVEAISNELNKWWPGSVLVLTGATPSDERQALVDQFQTDPRKRWFISNQATGGKGLTLTAATLTVYYSNTFSGEERLQSEDRNHRIGQENEVTYVDLLSDLKIDRLIATALENKIGMYEFVQGSLNVEGLL